MKHKYWKGLAIIAFVLSFFYGAGEVFSAVHFITGGDTVKGEHKIKPCPLRGYNTTQQQCDALGKLLGDKCSTDTKYGKYCYCDGKYKYDQSSCVASGKIVGGGSCDGKFETCSCDLNKYKYGKDSCGDNKVATGDSCTDNGFERFEKCSCSSSFKNCAFPLVGTGTKCEDGSGSAKYASCSCSPEFNSTCQANGAKANAASCTEPNGTVKYSSNDCKIEETDSSSCPYEYRHYWNADGAYTIPTSNTYRNAYGNNVTREGGPCAFEGYGHTSTINIPAGKTYNTAVFRFWGKNNVVNGEFKNNVWMRFEGWKEKSDKFNWTFKEPATINGRIVIDENKIGTVTFEKGLYGDHYCEWATDITGKWNWVVSRTGTCPAEWYANNNNTDPCPYEYRHYWNSNGSYTIPTSDTYRNGYLKNITRAGGPCAFEGYGDSATINIPLGKSYVNVILKFWGNTTVNGILDVTRYIRFENSFNSSKYNYTFNDRVTVNGRIAIDPKMGTLTFKKGLYGKHTCEWVRDTTGKWDWEVIKTGDCPSEWYANGGK
ncbi:MAG: hypothetical protein ACK5N8_08890 [Alphaproteobacteria bacterium]